MKRTLKLTTLVAVFSLTCWLGKAPVAYADGSCESMHLQRCSPRGLLAPCTYADGSPGLCTCVGRWDCLL